MTPCPQCGHKPNARWECSRIACPLRRPQTWTPDSVHHDGFERVVSNEPFAESDGYRRKPQFEE